MATVWRIEDECGCGPYNPRDCGRRSFFVIPGINGFKRYGDPDRPAPSHDGMDEHTALGCLSAGWICGFASLEDLTSWFPPEIHEHLTAEGYGISKYRVPDASMLRGNHQVIFDVNEAKKICSQSLAAAPSPQTSSQALLTAA